MTFEIPELFAKLADPTKRDEVVAAYKEAGLGGERYGAVCPVFLDEERTERCNKRICPQGWAFANSFENAGKYCLHRENYDGTEEYLDITKILEHHGLPWRPLRTLTRMRENKPNKKKGTKKNVKEQGSAERSGNGSETGRRGSHASHSTRSSDQPEIPSGPTFGQYLDGKVDGDSGPTVSPSDGSSRGPRLFLARREREEAERRQSDASMDQGSATQDSD